MSLILQLNDFEALVPGSYWQLRIFVCMQDHKISTISIGSTNARTRLPSRRSLFIFLCLLFILLSFRIHTFFRLFKSYLCLLTLFWAFVEHRNLIYILHYREQKEWMNLRQDDGGWRGSGKACESAKCVLILHEMFQFRVSRGNLTKYLYNNTYRQKSSIASMSQVREPQSHSVVE